MVCRGRVGSQVSIQPGVGAKMPPGTEGERTWWAERDVVLFWREKDG